MEVDMEKNGMTPRLGVLVLACVFALSLPAGTAADEAVHFAYHFEEGYNQRYKVSFSEEVFWGSFSRTIMFDLEVTEKCTGVTEDGSFQIEVVFDKVEASMMMMDKMQDLHMAEQLTGQAIGFILDKFGETSEVRALGYIESWSRIETVMRGFVSQLYVYLPGESYSKGQSWEHTDETDNDGVNVTANMEYTFDEIKKEKGHECAKIEVESELGIGGIQSLPGGDYKSEGEGEGEAEMYFDAANALVVKLHSKVEIKMDQVPVSGDGETVESTVTYELKRELL
jgi:hypothetical protein